MTHARGTTAALAVLALAAGVVFSRALARAPRVERPLPPSPAAPEHLRPRVVEADFSPARGGEARLALRRVFGVAVSLPGDEAAVGDFNGDGSPDMAVLVRAAAGHAAHVSDPLANWTVHDCMPSRVLAAGAGSPPPPAAVMEGESFLAVVHGYRGRGWRDPDARQAYLVRGGPDGPWVARPRAAYPDLGAHREAAMGDVLAPARQRDSFVHWTGGRYACGGSSRLAGRRAAAH
jgi:hypothetical protein